MKQKQLYLKMPYEIMNLPELDWGEKVLLSHIYSFGAKGCWMSNKTLAEIFMTSSYTISRRLRNLRPFIYVKNPKGYYRTVWAKSHPDVQAAVAAGKVDKNNLVHYRKNAEGPLQKCSSDLSKSAI